MIDDESEPGELAYAALWRRGGARLLDYLSMVAVLFALQIIGVTSMLVDSAVGVGLAIAALYTLLEIVYVSQRGQTPAKELFKIRVERPDRTGTLGWGVAIVRWVIPAAAMSVPFAVGGVGFLLVPACLVLLGLPALFDPERRTPWDRLAGTFVLPYDAKLVEGPIKSRKQIVRNAMDRQISAVTSNLALMSEDYEDDAPARRATQPPAKPERVVDNAGDRWA